MESIAQEFSHFPRRTGVILLNMGGPEKPEDVRPFLYNIFSDREIIRLGPSFLQKPLAWYIARKRAPKSMATYGRIGGGSPITKITRAQEQALQKKLSESADFVVTTAMRYWHPTTREALAIMASKNVSSIVALSLYPHFSCATSGSSLNELKRQLFGSSAALPLIEIDSWPDHPGYISCLAEKIEQGLARFGNEPVELVYSAHSLPVSFIEEGDPYVDHLQKTIAAAEQSTGKKGRVCYQSRSGPVQWLAPSTPEMISLLAEDGCKNILMVPISFVSDHVETLVEINMQYRDYAAERGIRLETTESFNDDDNFIETLKDIVLESLATRPPAPSENASS
ncbi:MAG: ferrochelatase [Desulfofustis sp.]